jgi:hypothetical protein
MLNIGNHQIMGKRIKLKNNIIICEKYKDKGEIKIKIMKVIKDKILFNSRPTPILTDGIINKKNNVNN